MSANPERTLLRHGWHAVFHGAPTHDTKPYHLWTRGGSECTAEEALQIARDQAVAAHAERFLAAYITTDRARNEEEARRAVDAAIFLARVLEEELEKALEKP